MKPRLVYEKIHPSTKAILYLALNNNNKITYDFITKKRNLKKNGRGIERLILDLGYTLDKSYIEFYENGFEIFPNDCKECGRSYLGFGVDGIFCSDYCNIKCSDHVPKFEKATNRTIVKCYNYGDEKQFEYLQEMMFCSFCGNNLELKGVKN